MRIQSLYIYSLKVSNASMKHAVTLVRYATGMQHLVTSYTEVNTIMSQLLSFK